MATRPPRDIPGIDQTLPDNLRRPLERMREAIQILLGARGDGAYRAATAGSGSSSAASSGSGGGGAGSGTPADEPDLTPPPEVTGLTAGAAISHVLVSWDAATYTQGHGHQKTNIYAVQRATTDPSLPTFGDAQLVYEATGGLTIAAIPSEPNMRWHLWAKWETVDGVESVSPAGGINGVTATTGQDVRQMLNAITHAALTPGTEAYSKLVLRADLFAIAPEVDYAQESAPISGMSTGQVWFKPSTEGFSVYNGTAWVAYTAAVPFIVQTVPTTINGVTIPAGVYMDSAFIYDLTASIARLGAAWIDDLMVAELSAAKLTVGDGTVGGNLKSTTYTPGSGGTPGAGWLLTPGGWVYANNAVIYGTVYASAGVFTGTVYASAGSFTGTVTAGAGAIGGVEIDATGIESSNYTAGPAGLGFRLQGDGTCYLPASSVRGLLTVDQLAVNSDAVSSSTGSLVSLYSLHAAGWGGGYKTADYISNSGYTLSGTPMKAVVVGAITVPSDGQSVAVNITGAAVLKFWNNWSGGIAGDVYFRIRPFVVVYEVTAPGVLGAIICSANHYDDGIAYVETTLARTRPYAMSCGAEGVAAGDYVALLFFNADAAQGGPLVDIYCFDSLGASFLTYNCFMSANAV